MTTKIHDLLYYLGLTENFSGFHYLACAILVCATEPSGLLLVTKRVYPVVARQCHTTSFAVERSIRTAGHIIWTAGRPQLEALTGRPLTERPKSAQLLALLLHCVQQDE